MARRPAPCSLAFSRVLRLILGQASSHRWLHIIVRPSEGRTTIGFTSSLAQCIPDPSRRASTTSPSEGRIDALHRPAADEVTHCLELCVPYRLPTFLEIFQATLDRLARLGIACTGCLQLSAQFPQRIQHLLRVSAFQPEQLYSQSLAGPSAEGRYPRRRRPGPSAPSTPPAGTSWEMAFYVYILHCVDWS